MDEYGVHALMVHCNIDVSGTCVPGACSAQRQVPAVLLGGTLQLSAAVAGGPPIDVAGPVLVFGAQQTSDSGVSLPDSAGLDLQGKHRLLRVTAGPGLFLQRLVSACCLLSSTTHFHFQHRPASELQERTQLYVTLCHRLLQSGKGHWSGGQTLRWR
jgi:hypothetical protein